MNRERFLMPTRRTPLAMCVATALAAGLAAQSALGTDGPHTARPAAVITVANCADDGRPGTLREAISDLASSGDTVDLTQLTCSTITLLSGQIDIAVDDLTINGPGLNALTIDGNYGSSNAYTYIGRVFNHEGSGTLTINGLTIANGLINDPSDFGMTYGGCILSIGGSVTLNDSTVTGCRVIGGRFARGGGVNAHYQLALYNSTISNNQAIGFTNHALIAGGGVYSGFGPLVATNSLIDRNRAVLKNATYDGVNQASGGGLTCYAGPLIISGSVVTNNFAGCDLPMYSCEGAVGGAIRARNGLTMLSTTVSNNVAESSTTVNGAAIDTGSYTSADGVTVVDSTISNNYAEGGQANHSWGGAFLFENSTASGLASVSISGSTINNNAADRGGGIFLAYGGLTVSNTTISGNSATSTGGGIFVAYFLRTPPLTVENSTVTVNSSSGNPGGGGIVDLNVNGPSDFESSIVAGNTNTDTSAVYDADLAAGIGSITGAGNLIVAANGVLLPPDTLNSDPMLGLLEDNGGPTLTHALLSGSPAIDTGNNLANLDFDQRGSGFPRVSGVAADIGAFEIQAGIPDVIFANGFDASP